MASSGSLGNYAVRKWRNANVIDWGKLLVDGCNDRYRVSRRAVFYYAQTAKLADLHTAVSRLVIDTTRFEPSRFV